MTTNELVRELRKWQATASKILTVESPETSMFGLAADRLVALQRVTQALRAALGARLEDDTLEDTARRVVAERDAMAKQIASMVDKSDELQTALARVRELEAESKRELDDARAKVEEATRALAHLGGKPGNAIDAIEGVRRVVAERDMWKSQALDWQQKAEAAERELAGSMYLCEPCEDEAFDGAK